MRYEPVFRALLNITGEAGHELHAFCPFHTDAGKRSFSANCSTGKWNCFAKCGGGSFKKFLSKARKDEALRTRLEAVGTDGGPDEAGPAADKNAAVVYVPDRIVKEAVKNLWSPAGKKAREFLEKTRGIKAETIKALGLGLADADLRIWIPHTDAEGVRNVKRYDFLKATGEKYKNYAGENGDQLGYGKYRALWPRGVVEKEQSILLLEGEMDVVLAHSLGLKHAVTVTGGAGTWEDSFTRVLAGKQVVICYDIDESGIEGANKIAKLLSLKTDVRIAKLPITEPKTGDFTDYMKTVKFDVRPFIENVLAPALGAGGKPVKTTLNASATTEVYGKKVTLRAVVSGRDLSHYMIPTEVEVKCRFDEQSAACMGCPLKAYRGQCKAPIPETSKVVVASPESTDGQVEAVIREYMGVPEKCPGFEATVTERRPLWDCILTNDIDSAEGQDYQQFAQRRAFSLMDLQPNVPYEFDALSTKDPKTQAALLLILMAKTSQTSLDAYSIAGKEKLLQLWEP